MEHHQDSACHNEADTILDQSSTVSHVSSIGCLSTSNLSSNIGRISRKNSLESLSPFEKKLYQDPVPGAANNNFRCDPCNKSFNSEQSLSTHLTYHKDNLVNMWSAQQLASPSSEVRNEEYSSGSTMMPTAGLVSPNNPLTSELQDIHITDMKETLNTDSSMPLPSLLSLPNGYDRAPLEFASDHLSQPPLGSNDTYSAPQQRHEGHQMNSSSTNGLSAFNNIRYASPLQPSPQPAGLTPLGPSSHGNGSGHVDQYAASSGQYFPNFDTMNGAPLPHPSPGMLNYSQYHSGQTVFTEGYPPNSSNRFHPYGRSPSESPNVNIKEEPIKAEKSDILDLDSHRFVSSSASDTSAVGTNYGSSINSVYTRNETSTIVSNNMFGGGTVLTQQSSTSDDLSQGAVFQYGSYQPQSNAYLQHQQFQNGSTLASPAQSPNGLSTAGVSRSLPQDNPPTPSASEYPSHVKRPKNFRCETCLKWFTSQGHLKRHFNTNIHKNLLKQKEVNPELTSMNSTNSTSSTTSNSTTANSTTASLGNSIQSPVGASGVLSPASNFEPNFEQNDNSRLMRNDELKSGDLSASYSLPSTAITTQPHRPASLQASGGYSSVGTYQPEFSQPQYSQIHTTQPQYASLTTYQSELPAISSSTTYHGHFTTNSPNYLQSQSSIVNSSLRDDSFFSTEPTPIVRGGFSLQTELCSPGSGASITSGLKELCPSNVSSTPDYPMKDASSDVTGFQTVDSTSHSVLEIRNSINHESPSPRYIRSETPGTIYVTENSVKSSIVSEPYTSDLNRPTSSTYESPDENSASVSPDAARVSDSACSPSGSPSGSPDSLLTSGSSASPEPDKKKGALTCLECGQSFEKKCYLTQHSEKHRVGSEAFKCEKCGKKYKTKEDLEFHVKKHDGDKPYKCSHDSCTKQFNHKTDLRRHMCLHTGEKPFTCETCNKGFIRKDHMMKHEQTHRKNKKPSPSNVNISIATSSISRPLPSHPAPTPPFVNNLSLNNVSLMTSDQYHRPGMVPMMAQAPLPQYITHPPPEYPPFSSHSYGHSLMHSSAMGLPAPRPTIGLGAQPVPMAGPSHLELASPYAMEY